MRILGQGGNQITTATARPSSDVSDPGWGQQIENHRHTLKVNISVKKIHTSITWNCLRNRFLKEMLQVFLPSPPTVGLESYKGQALTPFP